MWVKTIVNELFMANTYLLVNEDRETIIIDPGSSYVKIINELSGSLLSPIAIIATHGHIDHIIGVAPLKRRYKIPFYIHKMDIRFLSTENYPQILKYIGIRKIDVPKPSEYLDEGSMQLGDFKIDIIHTPGHTPGSVSIMVDKKLFTGDTLFKLSIGRADLGGNLQELISSIHNKIFNLPTDTEIFPGHGEMTTINHEILYNPYVGINGIYSYRRIEK